jgi:thymidylate kinase
MIILEGPDGGGKSTLAANLERLFDFEIHHHGPYPEISDPDELADKYVASITRDVVRDVVMDRSWISESIYGPIVRGHSRLSHVHAVALGMAASVVTRTIVVLALPSFEDCERACAVREEYAPRDIREKIYEAYQAIAWRGKINGLPVRVYNYTTGDNQL